MQLIGLAVVLVVSLTLVPLMPAAQQGAKVPRIGILWVYSPAVGSVFADAFRQGLRGLGYVEGRTIVLEERWAEGKFDRLPSLAGELVRLNVDVIVTASTPAAQAAQQATRTIPVVITLVTDPVESGIAEQAAREARDGRGLGHRRPPLAPWIPHQPRPARHALHALERGPSSSSDRISVSELCQNYRPPSDTNGHNPC